MPPASFAERLGRTDADTTAQRSEEVAVPTLVVGASDDRAEREADRVAGEVIARLQVHDGAEPHQHAVDCGHVQRSAAPVGGAEVGLAGGALSPDLSGRIEGRRGGGSALPGLVRERLEAGFGGSLAQVRVHDDAESAELNRAVSARAFTTGNDIFFGAGEYRPDTPEGEHVLAHEVAHTRQQGGGARRTVIRRWDIRGAVDLSTSPKVGVVSSGQAVFFLEDDTGDKLVVKAETGGKVGLSEIGSALHVNISKVQTVRHRKLGLADVDAVNDLIEDEAKLDRPAWEKLGKMVRVKYKDSVDAAGPDASDAKVGVVHQQRQMGALRNETWMAMDYVSGASTDDMAKKEDTDAYSGQKNALRRILSNRAHVKELGVLTAVDLFFGNADRLRVANLGNWMYDPYSEAMTVIDHVDTEVKKSFAAGALGANLDNDYNLQDLKKSALRGTATECIRQLGFALADTRFGKADPEFAAWLDEGTGGRRKGMIDALTEGLTEGKKLVIRTFTSTRFSTGKAGREARAAKKQIKATAREAQQTDQAGVDYYAILKARAAWLQKN